MPNLVGVGDSITAGDITNSAPYINSLTLGPNWVYGNRGIDSDTLALMSVAPQSTLVDGIFNAHVSNVLVVWAGTNDFFVNGSTVSAVSTLLTNYCQARQATGWKVVVVPMMSRVGNNPVGGEPLDTDKTAYNAFIATNWPSFASAMVTLSTNLTANGAYANSTYFLPDGTHPTVLSVTTLIAPEIQAAVSSLGLGGGIGLAVVNTANGGSGVGSSPIGAGFLSTSNGNLLVVQIVWVAGASVTSVKNAAGVSLTSTAEQDSGGGASQFFFLPNITGNPVEAITATFSASAPFSSIFAWEVMGADKVSPLDVTTLLSSGTGTTATTGTFSTSTANEVVFATMAGGQNSTFTAGAGYTLDSAGYPSGSGNLYRGSQHRIFSTMQSNITTSMSQSSSASWLIQAAAFKQAAAAKGISYAFEA